MKATEDESKRSPTRRRLFGPVDHNQNKVDASLIWTNINPGFPRVDYSPRFRPRPVDTDRSTEAGRRDAGIEGEVEMEGDVQTESGVETVDYGRGEPDRRRRTGISSIQSADNFDASLNSIRSWDPNTSWARSDMATTASDLASSGRRPASPTPSSADGSSARRRRPVSEHHPTNDCSTEETVHTGSSSPTSLDPSCRSRPATCPWRTLTTRVRDEGRMRSASLGHVSRPSCSRQRSSCRNSTTEGPRGSPDLEPTYKKVPIVQLRGTDVTTVLCPPGQNYFFKPIGGGEESPALTASQSADEGGDDEESSGGTRGSIVESRQGTLASAENDVLEVDNCCLGREGAEGEDQCPGQQQQQERQQSTRRRRQSTNETDDSLEQEKGEDEEDEVAGHDCSDRDAGNEGARPDRTVLMSGRRIKDKLVTTPPKAKKRKPHEDGNSDSPY